MLLFHRRDIQRDIVELARHLSPQQVKNLLGRLNKPGPARLAACWEAGLLAAFARVCPIRHEDPLPNGACPDLWAFRPGAEPTCVFVADITTVSDVAAHQLNPVDYFDQELLRLARKAGLSGDGLHVQIGSSVSWKGSRKSTRLKLPPKAEIPGLLKRTVLPFFEHLRKNKPPRDSLKLSEADVDVTITYDAARRFFGSGHAVYVGADDISANVLWNALRAKARRLKSSANTPVGIIVCDADCHLLAEAALNSPHSFTNRIVQEFLRQHTSISFVAALYVQEFTAFRAGAGTNRQVRGKFFATKDECRRDVHPLIEDALQKIAVPACNIATAEAACQGDGYSSGGWGGYHMNDSSIRMSMRSVLRLLAGDAKLEEFEQSHGWRKSEWDQKPLPNPFLSHLKNGRLITRIDFEKGSRDDDYLTFHFGDPDPAVSPFQITDPNGPFPWHVRRSPE